jgi:hypothetical protein
MYYTEYNDPLIINILNNLANDEDVDIRKAVASNPSTPVETLKLLSTDTETCVKAAVAKNIHTSLETLDKLSRDNSPQVRINVVENLSHLHDFDWYSYKEEDLEKETEHLTDRVYAAWHRYEEENACTDSSNQKIIDAITHGGIQLPLSYKIADNPDFYNELISNLKIYNTIHSDDKINFTIIEEDGQKVLWIDQDRAILVKQLYPDQSTYSNSILSEVQRYKEWHEKQKALREAICNETKEFEFNVSDTSSDESKKANEDTYSDGLTETSRQRYKEWQEKQRALRKKIREEKESKSCTYVDTVESTGDSFDFGDDLIPADNNFDKK